MKKGKEKGRVKRREDNVKKKEGRRKTDRWLRKKSVAKGRKWMAEKERNEEIKERK